MTTDNHRLAVAALSVRNPGASCAPQARVLPAVAVALLGRLAETVEGEIQMGFGRDPSPSSRWAGQPFPAARRMGRTRPGARRCRHLLRAAWRCRWPVCLARSVRRRFCASARTAAALDAGARPAGPGVGSVRDGLLARCGKAPYQGGLVRLALEPRYLVELLRCLEGEATVELGLTDADTPALFRAGGYLHVLMPLRLD